MNNFQIDFITLLRSTLTDEIPNISDDFDFEAAFSYAMEFHLTPILFKGINNLPKSIDFPGKRNAIANCCKEIAVNNLQMQSIKKICNDFEKEGIDYCLIKGSELKYLYPSPELRPMSDADILIDVDKYDSIKEIMSKNGFVFLKETPHDYCYAKSGGVEFELHKRLVDKALKRDYRLFKDCWKHVDNHVLNPDMSYLYQFAHFSRHCFMGSIPLKHIIDLYIFKRKYPNLDMSFINSKLEELELGEFHKNITDLIDVWFCNAPSNESVDTITDMVFWSREKRNKQFRVSLFISSTGNNTAGKFQYLTSMIFPSFNEMQFLFPSLEKYPFLLPVFWIIRPFQYLTKKRNLTAKRFRETRSIDKKTVSEYSNLMKSIGLNNRKK